MSFVFKHVHVCQLGTQSPLVYINIGNRDLIDQRDSFHGTSPVQVLELRGNAFLSASPSVSVGDTRASGVSFEYQIEGRWMRSEHQEGRLSEQQRMEATGGDGKAAPHIGKRGQVCIWQVVHMVAGVQ